MTDKVAAILPVCGNHYYTPYGIYVCEVTEEDLSHFRKDLVKVEVQLRNEKEGTQPVRHFSITGTREIVAKKKLSLVIEIHQWALEDRNAADFLEKEAVL
jgi:hypothetical protein